MKKALVLSGGSVKGAFQAGAIQAFTDHGWTFDHIHGISVGSLNGTFLSHQAAIYQKMGTQWDWKMLGAALTTFWKERIKEPKDIAIKRRHLGLLFNVIRDKFKGLSDTEPLQELVKELFNPEFLKSSPIGLTVGAVNIKSGELIIADPHMPNFLDYVLASAAIPIAMPTISIAGNPNERYLDGGIRDVAPLKQAIERGATEIVCITCQSENLNYSNKLNVENLGELTDRIMEVVVNEIVNNDIEWLTYINKFVPSNGEVKTDEPFKGCRKIDFLMVRPESPLKIQIDGFNSDQIKEHIDLGYQRALQVIQSRG